MKVDVIISHATKNEVVEALMLLATHVKNAKDPLPNIDLYEVVRRVKSPNPKFGVQVGITLYKSEQKEQIPGGD